MLSLQEGRERYGREQDCSAASHQVAASLGAVAAPRACSPAASETPTLHTLEGSHLRACRGLPNSRTRPAHAHG